VPFFALHIKDWLATTAKNIAAWAGLFFGLIGTGLSLRREWLERIRLTFRFQVTFIEEDDPNSNTHFAIDGVPSVEAVIVSVTNLGRGVTIEQCRCEYEASFHDGVRVMAATTHVGHTSRRARLVKGVSKSTQSRFGSRLSSQSTRLASFGLAQTVSLR
jgi:hypothetical protein